MDSVCEKECSQAVSCCRNEKKTVCNENREFNYIKFFFLFSNSTVIQISATETVIKQKSGKELSGLTHECGVFGAIACGDWPTEVHTNKLTEFSTNFD